MSEDKNKKGYLETNVIEGELKYPDEPARWTGNDINALLLWANDKRASDITIQTEEQIMLEINGNLYRVTNRRLDNTEVFDIIVATYGSDSAKATLNGVHDLDWAHEIRPDRSKRVRFRMNATPIFARGEKGVQITARTIPSTPPKLEELGIEQEIIDNMVASQGMIIVTGATGSGKSTLLAAIIRSILEKPDSNKKILTYEAPIEFVYDSVDKPSCSIAQTEIYKNLESFEAGTRNSLRRAPDIILIGEARDAETMGEAIVVSTTGHLLYTTVHTNGFAETIRRMVNVFPAEEKNSRAFDIISALNMVISQRLVPSTDGRRVALREYVIFNDEVRNYLLEAGVENLSLSSREVLKKYGRSFAQAAEIELNKGRISQATYKEITDKVRMEEKDVVKQLEIDSGKEVTKSETEQLGDLLLKLLSKIEK